MDSCNLTTIMIETVTIVDQIKHVLLRSTKFSTIDIRTIVELGLVGLVEKLVIWTLEQSELFIYLA